MNSCEKFGRFIRFLDEYLYDKSKRHLRITQDQKEVIESSCNTVCAANAGSGKTMVLALRYLYLIISSGETILPKNILALTFTRKAAAEMRDRIGEYMSLAQRKECISSSTYESFSDAQITTIDGFLAEVVKAGAVHGTVSIPLSFSESDSVNIEEIYYSFRESDDSECLDRLAGFTRLEALDIFRKAAKYSIPYTISDAGSALDKLMKELEPFKDNPKKELFGFLDRISDESDSICRRSRSKEEAVSKLEESISKIKEDLGNGYYLNVSSKLEKSLTDAQVKNLYKILCNTDIGNKKITYSAEFAPYIQKLQCAVINEANPSAFGQCADDINHIVSYIRNWKIEHGKFTYLDISYMARYILEKDRDIRRFFNKKIRKIMIDEFQDDNSLQKEILYLLSKREDSFEPVKADAKDLEDGKLFFVGDDKQSIYRFRGADVSVFNELPDELGLSEPLSIRKNFRSAPELIAFFNHVFGSNCFSSEDSREKFEADFSRNMESDENNESVGRICLAYNILENKKRADPETEASFIADSIVEKIRNEGVSFRDIMILYRGKGKKGFLEKELTLYGIPYTIDGPSDLASNAIAGDFAALFSTMSYPDDRVSRIAILGSPFVQLSKSSISMLMSDPETLDSIFSDGEIHCLLPLKQEELKRLQCFHASFIRWCAMINRVPLTLLLDTIWVSSGYKEFLADHYASEYFVHFDYLFAIAGAIEKQGGSLIDFISILRDGNFDNIELDYLPSQENAVRLMTIHKSKGLESKIVYIFGFGDVFSSSHNERAQLPRYVIENGNSFFLTPVISDRIFGNDGSKEELAESKRLFYVALTRARNELIMVSSFGISKYESRRFLNWIFETHGISGEKIRKLSSVQDMKAESEGGSYTLDLINIGSRESGKMALRNKTDDISVNWGKYTIDSGLVSKGISMLDEFTGTSAEREALTEVDAIIMNAPDMFGTLVHSILEGKVNGHDVVYDCDFSEDSKLNNAVLAFAENLADRFMDSDFAKSLFDGAEKKLTEQRFFIGRNIVRNELPDIRIDADLYEGVIDLIVVKHDRIIVVDYKTDSEINPENHVNQLKVYMAVIKKSFKQENVDGYLYYLRYGKEIRV